MTIKEEAKKVAFVTGGSRGIGAAIVAKLASEGIQVAFTYSSSESSAKTVVAGVKKAGGTAIGIQADSADPEQLKEAIGATVQEFGTLDYLINNAGIARVSPIDQFSVEDFDKMIAVNVKAVFIAAKEASRYMKRGGRIITIGSINADHVPFAGGSVYAMTKAAVAGFTRGLARDLGGRGITVNNIQPGPIDTDMNPATGQFAESLKSMIAVSRYGRSDEVAAMVSYLISDEAAFVTGSTLTIDGGFSA